MSAERAKSINKESRREMLGRWGQLLGFLGGAAIALSRWSIEVALPFFLYTEAGAIALKIWGKQNREKSKKESFFTRRTVKAAGAH